MLSSTVSKVLRHKEKYLYQDDGSRSPIKRSKGKFPDIERALSNWAMKQQKKGLPLTDAMIREKARFFAATVGSSDGHLKTHSASWLEKFKQRNNLTGPKSRKSSVADESDGTSNSPSNAHTPAGISPASPKAGPSPSPVAHAAAKVEAGKTDSPDSFGDFGQNHGPFHSQSNTSLSSVFTDATPPSFSARAASPTSPYFSSDSVPQNQHAGAPPPGSNFQRPRSQTFPMLVGVEQYLSPPGSSETMTPKYASAALDSPMSDLHPALTSVDEAMQPSASAHGLLSAMQPPPLPATAPASVGLQHGGGHSHSTPMSPRGAGGGQPSQDDARRALELVMSFFEQQPGGFVEPQEYVMIGKLMEKLKLKRGSESLIAGLKREADFASTTVD